MLFHINPNEPVPIYRQLVRQVRDAVASGRLAPGDKLPSQRMLSQELIINHLTVKKAYETLETDGLIFTDRGRGTFVSQRPQKGGLHREGIEELARRIAETVSTARLLGLSETEFLRITKERWHAGKR